MPKFIPTVHRNPFYLHFKQMKSIEPLIYSVHSAFCLNVRMACAQHVTIVVCIAHDLQSHTHMHVLFVVVVVVVLLVKYQYCTDEGLS